MSYQDLLQHVKMTPTPPSVMGSTGRREANTDHISRMIDDAYQAGLAAGGDAGFRAGRNSARGETASALVATLKQLMRIADAADLNETLALTIRCHHENLCRGHVKNTGMGFQRWN